MARKPLQGIRFNYWKAMMAWERQACQVLERCYHSSQSIYSCWRCSLWSQLYATVPVKLEESQKEVSSNYRSGCKSKEDNTEKDRGSKPLSVSLSLSLSLLLLLFMPLSLSLALSLSLFLNGVLWAGFWTMVLSIFPVAHAFMSINLNCCLIAPYDIIKVVVAVDSTKLLFHTIVAREM